MSTEGAWRLPVRDVLDMTVPALVRLPMPGIRCGERLRFRVCLCNVGHVSLCLRGRKWMLHAADGSMRVMEAAQVFNCRPVLERGAVFSFGGELTFPAPAERVELRLFGEDQVHSPFITPPLVFPLKVRRR